MEEESFAAPPIDFPRPYGDLPADWPEWFRDLIARVERVFDRVIEREFMTDHVQAALAEVPEERWPEHVSWFIDFMHDKLVRDTWDVVSVAALREALRHGSASWIRDVLRTAIGSHLLHEIGADAALEAAWKAVRVPGKAALGRDVDDRLAMLQQTVRFEGRRHVRMHGMDGSHGAMDRDRVEIDRRAARDGKPSRRSKRAETIDVDGPSLVEELAAAFGSGSPEDLVAGRQILDRVMVDAAKDAAERQLVERVLLEGDEPGLACDVLGLERKAWNRVLMRMKRSRAWEGFE